MVPKLFKHPYIHVTGYFLLILTLGLAMGLALTNTMVTNNMQTETGKVLVHWTSTFAALGTLELPCEWDYLLKDERQHEKFPSHASHTRGSS